jgi:hypothetical protein
MNSALTLYITFFPSLAPLVSQVAAPSKPNVIVDPGRPEWTEVYDLKQDPYELQNLPADGPLATQLEAEPEKQMTAVQFKPREK